MFRSLFSLHYFRRSLRKYQISLRIFLKSLKAQWTTQSDDPEMIGIMLMVSLLTGRERHERQTQFPPSTIELLGCLQLELRSLHSASIAATDPTAMPIKGHAANQKETFPSEFSGVGFLFMPLFSSVRRSRFQNSDISRAIVSRDCVSGGP
jgi:hypothetical protein